MTVGANYAFLSVLRRGLAALIAPGGAATDPRVDVAVTLAAGGSPVTAPPLALRGPGDVAGFDTGTVRRTWPTAGTANAESNYFPLIELADADLPWRYSPTATDGDRLTPWMCLIALEAGEIGEQVAAIAGRPLGTVTVAGSDVLPDLTQAWAWAHAQVLVAQDPPPADYDAASVGTILAATPSQALARLLCPRRLRPDTGYQAFLVPTFERGRLAGLGQPAAGAARLAPAWQPGQESVTLPVYYSWGFQTGDAGDFQSLVTKLTPVADVPDAVWKRDLAVSPPGAGQPKWQVVELASALLPLVAPSPPGPPAPAVVPDWPGIDQHGFTKALSVQTNASGARLDPPLYGRWLAAASSLSTAAGATPPWFHQLNGDPRARIAAGLGTLVVQSEQQQLLAGAWAQVAGIRAANERLRLSQLARELSLRLYARHLTPLDPQSLIQLTAPLHGRVLVDGVTVAAQLEASPIVPGALAPAWRRAARPLGTLAARQSRQGGAAPAAAPDVLARMNTGALSVVPSPGAAPVGGATETARLGGLAHVFSVADVQPAKFTSVKPPPQFAVLTSVAAVASTGATHEVSLAHTVVEGHAVVGPHPVGAVPVEPVPVVPVAPIFVTPPTIPVHGAVNVFAEAAGSLLGQLAVQPAAGVEWVQADLGAALSAINATLDPIATIEEPLVAQLEGVDAGPKRTDPLEPVMAAPSFPQPMYAPLAGIGREWLLPGLDQMSPDSIALFATNWSFVESYLVGLNHELARKLLWNGYPTDQRGTYFRRFWDVHGTGDDGEVGPIHLWDARLGQNRRLQVDPLILLVRGELIRRYPNVVVYAADAVVDNGAREPGPVEIDPIFFGLIEPDVALFGFDVDPAAARGDPGTFFVLQEHPAEPRFGLEVAGSAFGEKPADWASLGWDALAASADALAALEYVDLTAALPLDPAAADPHGVTWNAGGTPPSRAADLAYITLRRPARLAVHGSILIPDPAAGGGG